VDLKVSLTLRKMLGSKVGLSGADVRICFFARRKVLCLINKYTFNDSKYWRFDHHHPVFILTKVT